MSIASPMEICRTSSGSTASIAASLQRASGESPPAPHATATVIAPIPTNAPIANLFTANLLARKPTVHPFRGQF
jgi:hypothetical protein